MTKATYLIPLLFITLSWSSAKKELYNTTVELLANSDKTQSIAVLPFESQIQEEPKAGYSIAELIANATVSQGFQLVERTQLNEVLSEQALSGSGAIEEEQAIEIGKLLAAQQIITGSVTNFMGERIVHIKLIDASTSEVLNSKSLTIGINEFSSLQKELLGESMQKSAVIVRSAILPGWGQMYANKSLRGGLWMSSFLLTLGTTAYLVVDANSKFDTYQSTVDGYRTVSFTESQRENLCPETCDQGTFNTRKSEDLDEKWDHYNSAQTITYYAWAAVGTLWAANMVDAYIVSNERVKKFEPYFAAIPTPNQGVQLSMTLSF